MTVVQQDEFSPTHNATCHLCARHLEPPYLWWSSKRDLFVCGACCFNKRDGLIADLIHCDAVVQLQQIYPRVTLRRVPQ